MWVKRTGAAVKRNMATTSQDNHFQELAPEEDEEEEDQEGVKELTVDVMVSFHRLVEVL